jgi:hypothetical protein
MLDKEERRGFGVADGDNWSRATPSTIDVLDTGADSRGGFHARFLLKEGKISGAAVASCLGHDKDDAMLPAI